MLTTRWEEFRQVPELLKGRAQQPVFVDGRRMLEESSVCAIRRDWTLMGTDEVSEAGFRQAEQE